MKEPGMPHEVAQYRAQPPCSSCRRIANSAAGNPEPALGHADERLDGVDDDCGRSHHLEIFPVSAQGPALVLSTVRKAVVKACMRQ